MIYISPDIKKLNLLGLFLCIWKYNRINVFLNAILTWFYSFFPQYVVVSSKKILFYNDEKDKDQSNPSMVLDIE